jgi:hypothetical protein
MNLFHVTNPANVESILREGLRAGEDGRIFTLSDERLADKIAREQVFLRTYALLRIDGKGITGRVEVDEVAELSARWHRVIIQPLIAPKFIRLVGIYPLATGPTEWDYEWFGRAGLTREQVDARHAAIEAGKPWSSSGETEAA